MKHVLTCRRTFLSLVALLALFALGWKCSDTQGVTVAMATIVVGVAGANAYQRRSEVEIQASSTRGRGDKDHE